MKAFLRYWWYELAFWISFTGMFFGFSLRVRGRANIPRTGPVLLIANHQSYFDPPLIGLAAPRQLRFVARKTLFGNRFFSWLINSLNAVPIDQEGVAKEGLKTIVRQLEAGDAVLVFPEGGRTEDGRITELKPGILLLLRRVQAPIVPVGIAGAHAAWPRSQLLPIPAPLFLPATERTVAVSVGRPLNGAHYAAMPRKEALAELFHALQLEQEKAERLRRK